MTEPRVRLARPDVGDEELHAVAEVFADGMLTMGPRVQEFEAELARACETSHAVAVSPGPPRCISHFSRSESARGTR